MAVEIKQSRSMYSILIVLSIVAGLVLPLLARYLSLLSLPIIFFFLFIFPWLIREPFRLYLLLLITWPLLTLYIRIPLPLGLPDITYERMLVLMLFGIIFLDGFVTKTRRLKFGWLFFLTSIYIAGQLIARMHVILFGGTGEPDLDGLLSVIFIPIVMYWITKNILVTKRDLTWFLYALIVASLIISFSGFIDQVIGSKESIFVIPVELGGSGVSIRWMDVPGGRASGVMGNPGIYGAILGIGILASIGLFPHVLKKYVKIFLLVSTLILLFGVFASYTRQAWISVVSTLFLAQFFIADLWKRTLPLITVLLIIMVGFLVASRLMESRVLNSYNVDTRIELAGLAEELFYERPLLGWGFGSMDIIGRKSVGLPSHNMFLSLLVDGGLVLFIAFLSVLGYLIFQFTQIYRKTERNSLERSVLITAGGFILIFLLSGLARETRHFGYFNAMFWICAGVIDHLAEISTYKGEYLNAAFISNPLGDGER